MTIEETTRECEVLRTAATILDKPEKWTRGVSARDASGNRVPYEGEDAVQFCLIGCVARACYDKGIPTSSQTWDRAITAIVDVLPGYHSIPVWNDKAGRTYDEVKGKLDKAIEKVCRS